MRTEQEYANLERELDEMATRFGEQCQRNTELIDERDALAARVQEMRNALDDFPGLDCDTEDVLRWMRIKRKALATPEDSAAILARHDAAIWLEAAEVCGGLSPIPEKLTHSFTRKGWMQGTRSCADALSARAAELGKVQ